MKKSNNSGSFCIKITKFLLALIKVFFVHIVYLEVHGCQMNVNDAEIVSAILKKSNYEITKNVEDADIIFLITCAIRESAEEKIWHKLKNLRHLKKKKLVSKIGLLGNLKHDFSLKFYNKWV